MIGGHCPVLPLDPPLSVNFMNSRFSSTPICDCDFSAKSQATRLR